MFSRLGIYKEVLHILNLKKNTTIGIFHGSWLVQDDHAFHVAISHIAQDLRPMSCRDLQRWKFSELTYLYVKCGF